MKLPRQNFWPLALYLLFSLAFCAQVIPRILEYSLTADEPTDITNGYYYLTQGDTRTPHNHPPLAGALTSWPLLFMDLKTYPVTVADSHMELAHPSLGLRLEASALGDVLDRAHRFLFEWNRHKLEAVALRARLTSLGLGLGAGFLIFCLLGKEPWWLAGALFLWAFDPLLGTLSGLAKTDIAPTFFMFLSVLAFQRALAKTTLEAPLTAGFVAGLTMGCKFYALVLIPLFALLEWFYARESFKPRFFNGKLVRSLGKRWALVALGIGCALSLLYLPGTFSLPDHPWPWNSLAEKLREDLVFAASPHPVFFLGRESFQNQWLYLPCAFAVKEPIPILLLLGLFVLLAIKKRVLVPGWQWVSPLLFSVALLGAPNLGVRYLLPAFPFLFLLAGRAWAWMVQADHGKNQKAWQMAAWGLVVWQGLSVGLQAPQALSYFNDWVPAQQKMFLLGDSNLDWGQDLKRLAGEAKIRNWGRVRLAYYGAVDPQVYGLDWEPWTQEDLKGPQGGTTYAVNASFLQIAPLAYPPTREIAQSWVLGLAPTGRVGDTWIYFEIPGKKENNTKILQEEAKAPGKDKKNIFEQAKTNSISNNAKYLLSAPFLQTRGYCNPAFIVSGQ